VTYAPAGPGTLDSSLVIASDADNVPSLSVSIRGSSTPPPQMVVTPSEFKNRFGPGRP